MGEVDTKPIESVQAALSLFGGKNGQRKYRSINSESKQGSEKEEWELMVTDLANYKVQLEVKEYAYNQALLKIESYHITVDELYCRLKNCEVERDLFIEDCREVRKQVEKLEFRVKEMSDLLQEAGNAQEQLVLVVNELNATSEELHNVKAELAATEESKVSGLKQVELYETAVNLERQKTEELSRHVSELSETVLLSQVGSIKAEEQISEILLEYEIRMAATEAVQAQEQLEELCEQMDTMQELEDQLFSKTILADYLQLELKQAKELHSSSEQAVSDAINHLNQLKLELELVERVNSDQASHIEVINTEVQLLHSQLQNEKDKVDHLNLENDMLTGEIHQVRKEMDEISERDFGAQVEIALLNAEIHKGRSKIAAAEAAEASAKSAKAGLYLAVKQLAIEAEEAKNETKILKLETENAETDEEMGSFSFVNQTEKTEDDAETETGSFTFVNLQHPEYVPELELDQNEESTPQVELKTDDANGQITVSIEEYKSLIQNAQTGDQAELSPSEVATNLLEMESMSELQSLKKELEAARVEIEELRSTAEEAADKAEQAERAKSAIENQLRKWREHKQKKRDATLAALREDLVSTRSTPTPYNKFPTPYPVRKSDPPKRDPAKYNKAPTPTPSTPYQPLFKVLNMKL